MDEDQASFRRVMAQAAPAEDISDFDIQAFVDNSADLGADERARIRAGIDRNPNLRRRYEELERQKQLLKAWWEENKRESLQ